MSLRVVVLTLETPYGMRVLKALRERGVSPEAVVLFAGLGWDDCCSKGRSGLPRAAASWAWRRLRFSALRARHYRPFSSRVVPSGSINSALLVQDLGRLRPDILVLGGSAIISQAIIDTARVGVLNAHPGVLPWVRGLSSNARALEVGVPLGSTCHLVDGRIDSGALIERRLLPVETTSLSQLEEENSELAARLLADIVAQTVARGAFPRSVEQEARFPLGRRQTKEERQVSILLAQNGRARELFEQWKPLCLECDNWTLPPAPFTPPKKPNLLPLDVAW